MKKVITVIFLIIFLSACMHKESGSIVSLFENSKQLSHHVLKFQDSSDNLLSPAALEIYNDLLIVLDVRAPRLFSAIDLKSGKLIKSWGNVGQGPGELVGVLDFYANYSNIGINAWDPILKKLNFCSYDSLQDSSNPQFENLFGNIKNPDLIEMFYPNVLQLSESTFLALGNNKENRFSLLDISANSIKDVGDYPQQDTRTEVIPMFRNQAYNGMIRFNDRVKKVVYMSRHSEMFEIFNVAAGKFELAYGSYTTIPEYEQSEDMSVSIDEYPNRIGRNVALSTSEEKIFILYQEYKEKDMGNHLLNDAADIVLTFDWNGNPLQLYRLDVGVNHIRFDEKSNRLYAICNNPEPEIIYFDLTIRK